VAKKTKEEAQETRNAILDAAEVVFQERGVSRTSLAEIAAAAGVTRGAVYWHFANKADLFDAMVQRVFGLFEKKFTELQAAGDENPVDLLRKMACHFLERVVNDPSYFRMIDISWHKCEYIGEMAVIRDSHLECGNRYLEISTEAFRLAQERGFLPLTVEPRYAAVGLMSLIDGMVLNWTLDKKLFPLASYGPALIDTYMAGLGLMFIAEKNGSRE